MRKLGFLLVVLILSGCSVLDRGKVVEKIYTEPYITTKVRYTEDGEDIKKKRFSEKFEIVIEGVFEGEVILETRKLSEDEFNYVNIGSEVTFDENGKIIIP